MAVLLLGLVPWVITGAGCGYGDGSHGKIPAMNVGGGGGGQDDPQDPPPDMGDKSDDPSVETLAVVIDGIIAVSDLIEDTGQVDLSDTLWDLGINSRGKIIDLADHLQIPPQVWADYKAERLSYQIDDDWFWWFTSDPDLDSFIYSMTVWDLAVMAEGYEDWPLGG